MATTNYGWILPTVGASTDTWGTITNTAFEAIDTSLKTVQDSISAGLTAANNLSDVADVATSRSNLGLTIGSNVQGWDAGLASIANLTTASNKGLYLTGVDAYAIFTLTSSGRDFLGSADNAAMRVYLGLGSMALEASADYGALADANTWAAEQTFTLGAVSRGDTVMRVDEGTATNSGRVSWGTASPGTLDVGEIYLQVAS